MASTVIDAVFHYVSGVLLVLYTLKNWPRWVASWCNRKALDPHRPVPVPTDDPAWPNEEIPWCLRCMTVWPCRVWRNNVSE